MNRMTLSERKKVSLEILIEIDKICRENCIHYYLAYGTLIGAVRHKGFIPWDDDIDIWVKWDDYLKLINLCKLKTKYEVLEPLTKKDYPLLFCKISDSRTIVENTDKSMGDFKRGISVDIFPLIYDDGDKEIKRKLYYYLVGISKKMLKQEAGNYGSKHKGLAYHLCKFISLFGLNSEFWLRKLFNYISSKNNGNYLVGAFGPYFKYNYRDKHLTAHFDDSIEIKFEGHLFYAPQGYDKILRNIYGDYMKLPPKEQQISNHNTCAWWV